MRFVFYKAWYILLAMSLAAILLVAIIFTKGYRLSWQSLLDVPGTDRYAVFISGALFFILFAILLLSLYSLYRVRAARETPGAEQAVVDSGRELYDKVPDSYPLIADIEDYAIILLDTKGIIRSWNKGVQKIKGFNATETIGKHFSLFYTREDILQGLPDKILEEAGRFGKSILEGLRVRKDGTTFWGNIVITAHYDDRGAVTGFTKVTCDITERRKAEEKFHSLLDSAPDATVIVNEEGLIQMANSQTETLFAYARAEIIGKPVEMLIPAELRKKHIQHRGDFARSSKVRAMGVGIELNAVRKGGGMFPVEISLSPIQTDEGMLIAASVRDISHRKSLENELKKTNSELEAFTYSVSHDLRAPLRGIIGFTAVLEEEYSEKLDDEARRITSIIKNNTQKMGRLIDDLLNFSRTGRQELIRSEMNCRAMVQEVMEELTDENDKTRISWELRPLLPAKGDISAIRQVWINLLSNAIKYSRNRDKARIEIGSYAGNGQVVYYVKDNGVGFDEQYKDKLFRVFQRLHDPEEFDGTGVGLALVEKIVSKHGGSVWAEGKKNEGACFYFTLPV